MKKLAFLFFLFFISLNVNAATLNLPTPSNYFYRTDIDTPTQSSVTLDTWYGKNYYYGSRIGDFGSSTPRIYRLDYNFSSINLCNGQELSLTGYLASPGRIFQRVSMSMEIYAGNGNKLQCVFTNINDNEVEYKCAGKGGTQLSIYIFENSFITNVNENAAVSRQVTYSCDLNNAAIVEQSIANTQSIINNQNQNTQNIIQSQEQIAQATRGVNANLTSEADPNTSSSLDGFKNSVASDTPITDLITMPLTLINSYITGMNSSCSQYNFGSLLGTNLVMPCINLEQRIGSNLWGIIDVLFSIFMIFNISKLFISAFNNFTSLKDDFSNMYTNEYTPKHGGDN